jgi:selenocysteine lyase/cysteine desulfurase
MRQPYSSSRTVGGHASGSAFGAGTAGQLATRRSRIARISLADFRPRALCIASKQSTGTTNQPPGRFNAAALNGPHLGPFQISFTWHARRGESNASFRERVVEAGWWNSARVAHRIYLDAKRRRGTGSLPWTTSRSLCSR